MLSLRFRPIPIQYTTSPFKPKSIHIPQFQTNRTNSIIAFSPNSLPKLCATSVDTVAKEESRTFSGAGESPEVKHLPVGLRPELLPNHVAVIMDGNVRWARQRGLPASSGHEAGFRSLRELAKLCNKWGISVLTVFVFSLDNWARPKGESDFLMMVLETGLRSNLEKIAREKIRISVIGDKSKLPKSMQKLISETEKATKDNSGLHFMVAISYSGKYDIVKACKSIACEVKDGHIQTEDINEALVEQKLETNCTEFPCPDFLIRTSGELRVSNFLLWQLAYTELFFTEKLWPDFGEPEFVEALTSFQNRHRRYGQRDE